MYKAYVLVRNLQSSAKRLNFGNFVMESVDVRFKERRELFASSDVNPDDWIFEKWYSVPPPGFPGSPVGGIPNDLEDSLFILRLYNVGDIAFVKQTIILPSGNNFFQLPYRAMNDLNSYAALKFKFEQHECGPWIAFANVLKASRSWNADWFRVARRFFLNGGAKRFDPTRDDVDRIVDYATALEATLVPDKSFITRRMTRRAGKLVAPDNAQEEEAITNLVKKFYGMRSGIVHGNKLDTNSREWLIQNCDQVELRVRQVLRAAVQKLPADEVQHRRALAEIYDPTDEDRGNAAFDRFNEIKTPETRKAIAAKIARLLEEVM